MEFDVKLDYTMDDMQAYWRSFVRKKPETKSPEAASPKQMKWVGVLFLAAGFLTAALMSVGMGVLEAALGLLLLVAGRKASRPQSAAYSRWTRQMWKKYQKTGALYNCRFTGDGIWIHDSKSDHRYDYDFLEALWEDEAYFYLVLPNSRGAYILRKTAFTQGNPEDLPEFWQSRTGKPVRQINP